MSTTAERSICITRFDQQRLADLLALAREFNYRDRSDLQELDAEIQRAQVVESQEVPPTVVTMNSQVRLKDLDSGQRLEYRLVFPQDADIEEGLISVTSPIGTAILGYGEGDVISWHVPAGTRRIKIEKVVYQPEAAGDFDL